MIKKTLLALLCTTSFVQAAQEDIMDSDIHQAQTITIRFMYRDNNGEVQEIQKAFVDPLIRNLSPDKLQQILPHLVFTIKQLDNGEIIVRAHVKGLGGGPATASAAYWTTKLVGWGAYGTLVFFQPHAAAEALHAYEAIEVASNAAFTLGMMAPTA